MSKEIYTVIDWYEDTFMSQKILIALPLMFLTMWNIGAICIFIGVIQLIINDVKNGN